MVWSKEKLYVFSDANTFTSILFIHLHVDRAENFIAHKFSKEPIGMIIKSHMSCLLLNLLQVNRVRLYISLYIINWQGPPFDSGPSPYSNQLLGSFILVTSIIVFIFWTKFILLLNYSLTPPTRLFLFCGTRLFI